MGNQSKRTWDFIVIGTGMGGGTAGLRLAQSGFSVLFLERGMSPSETTSLKGQFAEQFPGEQDSVFQRAGRVHQPIVDKSSSRTQKYIPFMGSGVGGSSALFGAVLERFAPTDFQAWPISYRDLEPYYEEAESLFRVHRTSQFSHPANQELYDNLKSQGLHPYHLPLAHENVAECQNCQSFLCAKNCKNSSERICIQQAVAEYGAELLTGCSVEKIRMESGHATGVIALHKGQELTLSARNVLVAAGALWTPILLQRSGIQDESGQIGRNLMRHYVDLYAIKIKQQLPRSTKELAFNDFYIVDGQTLGTVQSFGQLPPASVLVKQIKNALTINGHSILAKLFSLVSPLVQLILQHLTSKRLVMASILQDSPQWNNRVWEENGQLHLSYSISDGDGKNIQLMRQKLKKVFGNYRVMEIRSAEKNEMLAHVCGTCRMGIDPKSSVVGTDNKVHGTDNIFVVDSSFFPTSGGTNPALTIAANALRAAELLAAKEKRPILNASGNKDEVLKWKSQSKGDTSHESNY